MGNGGEQTLHTNTRSWSGDGGRGGGNGKAKMPYQHQLMGGGGGGGGGLKTNTPYEHQLTGKQQEQCRTKERSYCSVRALRVSFRLDPGQKKKPCAPAPQPLLPQTVFWDSSKHVHVITKSCSTIVFLQRKMLNMFSQTHQLRAIPCLVQYYDQLGFMHTSPEWLNTLIRCGF